MHLLLWARAHSGLVSISGALVIFFSWVITNTLGQRYNAIKSTTESAQATFRLYTTLHEQRNQLNSLAMEVIQRNDAGSDATMFSAGPARDHERMIAVKQFNMDVLVAHQVNELMDFTVETNALSRSAGTSTRASDQIVQVLKEVDPIYQKLHELRKTAEQVIADPNSPLQEVKSTTEAYRTYLRSEAVPKVPGLYERIVDASNIRRREAEAELKSAKTKAERAAKFAIGVYVFGSLLALAGQAIEKTKPKEAPQTIKQGATT
jgi:hypothetical protein